MKVIQLIHSNKYLSYQVPTCLPITKIQTKSIGALNIELQPLALLCSMESPTTTILVGGCHYHQYCAIAPHIGLSNICRSLSVKPNFTQVRHFSTNKDKTDNHRLTPSSIKLLQVGTYLKQPKSPDCYFSKPYNHSCNILTRTSDCVYALKSCGPRLTPENIPLSNAFD